MGARHETEDVRGHSHGQGLDLRGHEKNRRPRSQARLRPMVSPTTTTLSLPLSLPSPPLSLLAFADAAVVLGLVFFPKGDGGWRRGLGRLCAHLVHRVRGVDQAERADPSPGVRGLPRGVMELELHAPKN